MYWKTGAEFRADHEAFRLGLVKYAVRGNNRLRADVQQVTPFFGSKMRQRCTTIIFTPA
jgi:hypothetical protein